jgi:hypothetical protein
VRFKTFMAVSMKIRYSGMWCYAVWQQLYIR